MARGHWPTYQIDHINGDRSDNRLANLRDVSATVNAQNQRKAYANNRAGLLGAHRAGKRYVARIRMPQARIFLGGFASAEEAHAAYVAAKRLLHEGNTL